jgi:hypothetical protein
MLPSDNPAVIVAYPTFASGSSQSRIYRLGFEREDRKDALVDPPQRLTPGHPVQRLEAEGVLAQGK